MSVTDTGRDVPKTLEQVAEETDLNYWWLRRMCADRKIEFTKVGRNNCLTRAQVEAAVQKRYVTVGTRLADDVARERERRAAGPRRRRTAKAA